MSKTVSELTKELGVSKTTIYNCLKKFQAEFQVESKDGSKLKLIETDLESRIVEYLSGSEKINHDKNVSSLNQIETNFKAEQFKVETDLETKLKAKEEIISDLKAQIEDLKADRDAWKNQAETISRLLDQQQQLSLVSMGKALPLKEPEEEPKQESNTGLIDRIKQRFKRLWQDQDM